jgi:hypothetical protein
MQSVYDDNWKQRGNRLESIDSPSSNFASEWWLVGYWLWKMGDNVRALYYRMKRDILVRKLERRRVKHQDIEVEDPSVN